MVTPQKYDAVVIGATVASYSRLAPALAEAGWKVALVERGQVGGTCINAGCTPTKTMIASARVAYMARRAGEYGPDNMGRVVEYGTVGEIPGAMFQKLSTMLSGPDAPDPHDIAEAIAQLIITPKGRRPARTVVGASFGADTLNEATEPIQAGTVEALGLGHLATVRSVLPKVA